MTESRVFALGFHADYRCRSTGACCTSGWEIPVTPAAEVRIRDAIDAGRLRVERSAVPLFRARRGLPEGARVAFGLDAGGRCAFFEPETRLCAVHRQVGAPALPASCRQFPRVALLTPRGVFLTLSHYCPTAARMLLREDLVPEVVAEPRGFAAATDWEGLDARADWPPLLAPGVLLGWDGFERWQAAAVHLLLTRQATPDLAVAELRGRARRACEWTPAAGELSDWLARAIDEATPAVAAHTFEDAVATWLRVAATVPASLRDEAPPLGPGAPPDADWEADERRRSAPTWTRFATPVRRYLASKAFASWAALDAGGLVAWCDAVQDALHVLRVEVVRRCREAGVVLDAAQLLEAFRRADLLLVHLARPGVS